jgi:hypothetical protein
MRRSTRRDEGLGAAIVRDNLALLVHGDHVGGSAPLSLPTQGSAWVVCAEEPNNDDDDQYNLRNHGGLRVTVSHGGLRVTHFG